MDENVKDTSMEPMQEGSALEESSGKGNYSHHSHHHSHSHHSSKSRRGRKIRRFFRKNKKKIINIVICTLVISALIFVAIHQDAVIKDLEENQQQIAATDSTIRVETTLFTEEVPLVVDAVVGYMDDSNTMSADQVYNQFHDQLKNSDIALPLKFAYDILGLPSDITVKSGVLELAEEGDFTKVVSHTLIGQGGKAEIYNLKTDTRYEYKASFTLSNGTTTGTFGEFTTKATPRFIKIVGLKNVRDIGGWKTVTGDTVKQGLLYRGIELDGASESSFQITSEGLSVMLETLGIQYDMDLRSASVNASKVDALGSGVIHKYYPISNYSEVLQENHNELVRRIFSDLGNKNNYPVYMHCTYGRDRTGTVCYLLQGLLGVSKEDAARDYELTAFAGLGTDKESFRKFQGAVDEFKGDTFQQKVENYLLSVGVTSGEIQNIRNIFLGE